ncbi:VOC family protein [Streptomyces sp. BE230]|uniref:VOC family protein n=1 Tax=Streptomyces sp. BE230 TaxID=3002526 RepID=UPI002ED29CFC|nr:VOC family protein [Streptomyces sp. BE230]
MTAFAHLALAAPALARTVARLNDGLGIRLAPGGSHPTAGTRNFPLGPGDSASAVRTPDGELTLI